MYFIRVNDDYFVRLSDEQQFRQIDIFVTFQPSIIYWFIFDTKTLNFAKRHENISFSVVSQRLWETPKPEKSAA